ncbi:FHA domain-containing protein [Arthrobacter sp. B10-11]|uniref:FHA domain-containing protein n=1 Tax=Arthrobacter sp. B10-11 TaxID=3081160 RepID=UPI0029546533|nr:FHA domain-containing protein [Arthrobacter sp. B10-11]MDV8149346.1 hypothetical protein [Arthrobacter sp. B10-11]
MGSSSYTPGTWLGVVRSGTAVLLPPATRPALVDSLWELLARETEVHEVLHAVTSASSGSLAQIPWFGIVDFRDSLRVFLRGDIELTAHLAAGAVELNGRDVTTWTERRLSEPEWYRIAVPGDAAAAGELPLGEGVVLLQSLTVGCQVPVPESPVADVPVVEVPVVEVPALQVPVPEAPVAEPEHGVSAETVMGIPEDELEYTDAEITVLPESPESPGTEAPEAVPASEVTGSYDHLWDKTVMRRIEDAAVRDEPEDVAADESAAGSAANQTSVDDAAEKTDDPQVAPVREQPPAKEAPAHVPVQPSAPAAPLIPARPQDGLIDSVPWNTGGDKPARPSGPPSFVPAPASPVSGDTPDRSSPAAVPPVLEGDHDGETIMKSDLAGLGTAPHEQADAEANGPATGPMVLARVCPQGHANPPTHSQCTGCGVALAADAVQVRRPRLGRVRVSTGELIDLDQSLVIGRQPSVSRVQGGGMPRLVQVASPGGDISRSHVEVRLEGWHVMLCDLKATNGTVLVREGQPPRRLAQNEMAILLDGDIAELGDNVSLRFEEIV